MSECDQPLQRQRRHTRRDAASSERVPAATTMLQKQASKQALSLLCSLFLSLLLCFGAGELTATYSHRHTNTDTLSRTLLCLALSFFLSLSFLPRLFSLSLSFACSTYQNFTSTSTTTRNITKSLSWLSPGSDRFCCCLLLFSVSHSQTDNFLFLSTPRLIPTLHFFPNFSVF